MAFPQAVFVLRRTKSQAVSRPTTASGTDMNTEGKGVRFQDFCAKICLPIISPSQESMPAFVRQFFLEKRLLSGQTMRVRLIWTRRGRLCRNSLNPHSGGNGYRNPSTPPRSRCSLRAAQGAEADIVLS